MFRNSLRTCGEKKSFLRTESTTQTKKWHVPPPLYSKFSQSMHPHLEKSDKFATNDCSNPLQGSPNKCVILLRSSKHGLDVEQFKFWSETYSQSSMLLFSGKEGLTPYQLKMLLIPELLHARFVRSPWLHICEAMKNSNHLAY